MSQGFWWDRRPACLFAVDRRDACPTEEPPPTRLQRATSLVGDGGTLDVIATYTAMIDVREAAARRAGVGSYWESGGAS